MTDQSKLSAAMKEALKEYARECYLEKIDWLRAEILRLQKELTATVDSGPPSLQGLPIYLEDDGKWHGYAGTSIDHCLSVMKKLAKYSGEEIILVFNEREYRSSMTDAEISSVFHG